jgi:hypothetical protein
MAQKVLLPMTAGDISAAIGLFPWSDFRLISEGVSISVRSSLLAALSPVIRRQLSSDPANLRFSFPHLACPSTSGLADFAAYLYGAEISLSRVNVAFLYAASALLEVPGLGAPIAGFLSGQELPWVLDVICGLSEAGIPIPRAADDPANLYPLLAPKIDDCLQIDRFYRADSVLIAEVIESATFQTAYPQDLVDFLLRRIETDTAPINRALAVVADKFLNPALLAALAACPSFDLRPIRARVTALVQRGVPMLKTTQVDYRNGPEGGIIAQVRASVRVTASSVLRPGFEPENALDFSKPDVYSSAIGPYDFIQVAFEGCAVAVSDYVLRGGDVAPVSWQLDASDDGVSWVTLHEAHDTEVLQQKKIGRCQVGGLWKAFSYFRLMQTKAKSDKDSRFVLGGFELFGSLVQFVT